MPHLLKLLQNNWSYDKKSYPHPHILTKFAQHLEISIRQFLPPEDLYIEFLT